jgi:hypothetical protein
MTSSKSYGSSLPGRGSALKTNKETRLLQLFREATEAKRLPLEPRQMLETAWIQTTLQALFKENLQLLPLSLRASRQHPRATFSTNGDKYLV